MTLTMTPGTDDIWRELSSSLRRFLRRRVGDDHVADDLLQETFLRIHHGLGSLTTRERLPAWVYRIARNAIADHYRRHRREARLSGEPPAVLPDQETVPGEVARCLTAMIDRLPEPHREAMLLTEVEGHGS